jgi:Trypsin-like peptidase domain
MNWEDTAKDLLASCSARLDTGAGPQGTAFFVAPGYAVTAAHVISGADGLPVQLSEGKRSWRGHVTDVRPPSADEIRSEAPYPATPNIALIKVDDGPEHACALLGRQFPSLGVRVMARGYTRAFDKLALTAETESFGLFGMLETPDPGCTLLKLALGEVTQGMSGAPVLDLSTGNVIGMLRTSGRLGSNLGGWVVPAELIRQLWPDEVSLGNDRFHEQDPRWRQGAARLRARSLSEEGAPAESGLSIGKIEGDVASVISGANVGTVSIEYGPASGRRGGSGQAEDATPPGASFGDSDDYDSERK